MGESGRGDACSADYQALGELKSIADQHGGGVLVVHHTRKGVADDPFDEVSGTLGINGAADSIFVLDRNRGETSGALYVTGRDIQEQTFSMAWDAAACLWTVGGRGDGITRIEKPRPLTKVEQCAAWVRNFLGDHSWLDAELLAAAKVAGFTEDNLARAKAKLRTEAPALQSKAFTKRGEWWNWFGEKGQPNPKRDRRSGPNAPEWVRDAEVVAAALARSAVDECLMESKGTECSTRRRATRAGWTMRNSAAR